MVFLGNLVLTRELSILVVVRFSPINLFFIIYCLTDSSKSWSLARNSNNSI